MILNKHLFPIIFVFLSCQKDPFSESQILGGKEIDTQTLNLGFKVYQAKCVSCHGESGDGRGVTYRALRVRPRNLTQGIYKFGFSIDGGLPSDDDFKRILSRGLKGTAMIPWGLTEPEMEAVIQYIKTFAPQAWGTNYLAPTRHEYTANPFKPEQRLQALRLGEAIYHEKAQCFACHPAYRDVNAMRSLTGEENLTKDSEHFKSKPQATEFFSGKEMTMSQDSLPPDFLVHNIRSSSTIDEIYLRLNVGVSGTSMPAWREVLSDEEIWALAFYVHELNSKKQGGDL